MRAGAPAAPRATSATAPATPESPATRGDPKRPHTKKPAPQQRPRAASADSKRNALLAALKSQATEATCAGHFELSNMDNESYWNHRSFADISN